MPPNTVSITIAVNNIVIPLILTYINLLQVNTCVQTLHIFET